MDFSPICSVCLAVTALMLVFDVFVAATREGRVHLSDVVWGCVFLAVQAVVFAWARQGLVVVDEGSQSLVAVVVANLACMASAHVACSRRRVTDKLLLAAAPSDWVAYRVISVPVAVFGACVVGALCTLAVELPHNQALDQLNPQSVALEWMLLSVAAGGLYFLGQRRALLMALVPVASTGLGLAEYFVYTFKGLPIQPGDVLALETAASVADGYVYTVDAWCLWGLAAGVVALLACVLLACHRGPGAAEKGSALASPRRVAQRFGFPAASGSGAAAEPEFAGQASPKAEKAVDWRPAGVLANATVGLALVASLVSHVNVVDYATDLGISVSGWSPEWSYSIQAYLPTFISACQAMIPTAPEGYSVDGVEGLLASYVDVYNADDDLGNSEVRAAAAEQFDYERPTVIAVMNETFSDLSLFDGMHAGYEGPQFYKSISDCLVRGTLYTSVNGGGTTNSEFEFLTGNSMAYFGSGIYPYNIYNMGRVENLAGLFKGMGYDTLAMHPYNPQNWNRTNVYVSFGFDEFLSIDDFEGAEHSRGFISDKATYEKILERLSEDEDPQFIFDVTMANHAGYETGLIPEEGQVHLEMDGEESSSVNEYVSCIQKSDEDLQYFIEALSQLDRKVVVVFFGDHQPGFSGSYNDTWYDDENDAEHICRIYQTSYFIWANYDVAGNEQVSEVRDVAASSLSSLLMQVIGAPMSDYQKAHMVLLRALPVVDAVCYQDLFGFWHLPNESSGIQATDQARADFEALQYYMMFGEGEDIFNTKMQDAANY